jgi:hypothetical protein
LGALTAMLVLATVRTWLSRRREVVPRVVAAAAGSQAARYKPK